MSSIRIAALIALAFSGVGAAVGCRSRSGEETKQVGLPTEVAPTAEAPATVAPEVDPDRVSEATSRVRDGDPPTVADASRATATSADELFLFHPTKYPAGNWTPDRLTFEPAEFVSGDGTRIHGWFLPVDRPRATLLYAHGNAGHVAGRADWLRYLQEELRVEVLAFDYRGYGRSEGEPTVAGCVDDARAARRWLSERTGVGESEMVLMGESLGGAIVCRLASESPPRALILQSTFASMRDVAAMHAPALAWLVPKSKLDSAAALEGFHGALLQSHGDRDSVVPFESGRRLFERAGGDKRFVVVPGADHNDWMTESYLSELAAFVDRIAVDRGQ